MENRFIEFETSDDVIDDVINGKIVDIGNELILEHNAHIADTVLHMSAEENNKLAGIETGAEVNNMSDTNATALTNGTDTTLHTHGTSGITGFAAAVRGMVLTGLSTATNAAITATDSVLSALGKLQKQITDHKTDYTLQVPYGGTTTGTANTYVLASPTITALSAGMAVSVKFNLDSTAASTLNWCGLGAKPIKKANGTDVTNLKTTGIYTLRYDGTNFILQGEGASGNATASDLISGKTATVDAGEITGTLALTGTAGAADILASKTAYNTDPKTQVTGTMPNRGAVTITPSTTNQAILDGYHNGGGYVVGDADLIGANIIPQANIFGVQGTNINKRWASGIATSSDTQLSGYYANGTTNTSFFYVLVSGLSFTPSKIIMQNCTANTSNELMVYIAGSPISTNNPLGLIEVIKSFNGASMSSDSHNLKLDGTSFYVVNGGFKMPALANAGTYKWIAFE